VGDTFVLNALGDGKHKTSLMKHFLTRFPPGADRFAGVATHTAANGSPVLDDCIAHLELKACGLQHLLAQSLRAALHHPANSLRLFTGQVAHGDARPLDHLLRSLGRQRHHARLQDRRAPA